MITKFEELDLDSYLDSINEYKSLSENEYTEIKV